MHVAVRRHKIATQNGLRIDQREPGLHFGGGKQVAFQPIAHGYTLLALELRPAVWRGCHFNATDLIEAWLVLNT